MTENTTTQTNTADVIKGLTAKGRDAMKQIGLGKVSFFDGGIVAGEGSWGGILTDDLGHKSSGVLNRLAALGLFETGPSDDSNAGGWWMLTALGADVANTLAKEGDETPAAKPVEKKAEKPAKKAPAQSKRTDPLGLVPTPAERKAAGAKKAPAAKAAEKKAEKPAKKAAWVGDVIDRHIAQAFAKVPAGTFLKAREITNTITKEFPKADERPSDVTVYSRCHGGRLPSGLTGQTKPCGATKN